MTTTANITWVQPDERAEGREDSCWYTFSSSGNDLIAKVTKGEREIGIYADGEMRILVYKKDENGEPQHVGTIRYCEQLAEFGIEKDDDLWGFDDEEVTLFGSPAWLRGPNKAGFYFDFIHTSWFDAYGSVEGSDEFHIDDVQHLLTDALDSALTLIDDDSIWDEMED